MSRSSRSLSALPADSAPSASADGSASASADGSPSVVASADSPGGAASPSSPRRGPGRRTVLALAGSAGAAAALGSATAPASAPAAPAARPRVHGTAPLGPATVGPPHTGTTLTGVAVPTGEGPFRRLVTGPGWRRVVRSELARGGGHRAARRVPLAAFVQFTDMHLVDVQHPLRYEYLRAQTTSAWRPQEALSVAGAVSLVERVNALAGGPATGASLSCVVTTGDNTDNNSRAELDWFVKVMSGGRIRPDTGDPRLYEGVQDSGLATFWQPDSDVRDRDKALGFPRMRGYLRAAVREVTSPGLALPWYATVGNHDALPGGCFASAGSRGFLADFATGDRKLMSLPEETGARLWKTVERGLDPKGLRWEELLRSQRRHMREVTPDPDRAPFTPGEYVRALAKPQARGKGPVGHGYTEADAEEERLYYSFRISDDVMGFSLDTTRRDGHYAGRLGKAQLRWLERQLKRHEGEYALVFSHHTSTTIPEGGARLVELLGANPHAVAWINGHSHLNRITAHGSFWEISTASHVDFPQLARAIELVDNRDGTLSLFTTLIESAAPHRTDFSDLSQTGLASLYRELACNSPGARTDLAGGEADRNTELLLRKP
ncbi:TIGR03767 family metallophosphoesterase [Streptomyces sp. NBC_01795]|uniref:TIGR03767 family metallophosphoesterase n=1 Tax=unclassified Streptomyces TaxID=2593676 RepID=UPI002DDBAAAC|nr:MULTISPECIES: TIGR03767 family metallophosphoesterase [unclassified Streptomyces]WSA94748.1 TIGR03767 family metallophosphoesterase [Streptomyces sp. NBC_01795]WSB79168.1 TIGR03767 family metallophosphoesterase [Streptomyces sp. NBC_01775]